MSPLVPRRWTALAVVAASALATVGLAERAARRVAPVPEAVMGIDDGVAQYAAGDPDVLVLGSSHARDFVAVAERVAARTHGATHLQVVPVEWGTFSAYDWVLEHRLRPLIEERTATGAARRGRLREVLLVTNYYDLCDGARTHFGTDLPRHAWHLGDWARDVAANGVTDYNHEYLVGLWQRALAPVALVQDRGPGLGRVRDHVAELLAGHPLRASEAEVRRENAGKLREVMEEDFAECDDPAEKAALASLLGYLRGRGLEVTFALFPFDPEIVTPRTRATTLERYSRYIRTLADGEHVIEVDMTLDAPLAGNDFEADLDRLRADRRARFADWALAHHPSLVLSPRPAPASRMHARVAAPAAAPPRPAGQG